MKGQGRRESGKSEKLAKAVLERTARLQRIIAEEAAGGIERSEHTVDWAASGVSRINKAKSVARFAEWRVARAAAHGGELTRLRFENAVTQAGVRARKHARQLPGATPASIRAFADAAKAARRAAPYKPREPEPPTPASTQWFRGEHDSCAASCAKQSRAHGMTPSKPRAE